MSFSAITSARMPAAATRSATPLAASFLAAGAHHNVIGGANAGAGNIISGNLGNGIDPRSSAVSNTSRAISSARTAPEKFARQHDQCHGGIGGWGGAPNNLIGGTGPAGNLISGNNAYGVFLADPGTSGNVIEGNFIGTMTGTNALGKSGLPASLVELRDQQSVGSPVAGRKPSPSMAGPAWIFTTSRPPIIPSAAIPFSTMAGWVLILTGAANNLQNFPVITNAFGYAASTIVSGNIEQRRQPQFFH